MYTYTLHSIYICMYVCIKSPWCTLEISYKFICHLYLNKAGKKKKRMGGERDKHSVHSTNGCFFIPNNFYLNFFFSYMNTFSSP